MHDCAIILDSIAKLVPMIFHMYICIDSVEEFLHLSLS